MWKVYKSSVALTMIMFSFVMFSAGQTANDSVNSQISVKEKSWDMLGQHVYFQLQGGVSYPFTQVKGQVGFGIDFMVGYQFTPTWGLRGVGTFQKLRGEGHFENPIYTRQPYNRAFNTNLLQFSIETTFDITQAIKKNTERRYGIYPFIGIGGMFYDALAWNTDDNVVFAERDNFKVRMVPVGTVGAGFKYSVARNWDVLAEFRVSLSNTRGIDITGTGEFYPLTAYSQLGVGVKYKLGVSPKTQTEEGLTVSVEGDGILTKTGDNVNFNVIVELAPKKLRKNEAIHLDLSMICGNGDTIPLNPITLQGEKSKGREGFRVNSKEGAKQTIGYGIEYTPEMENSVLIVTPVYYKPSKNKNSSAVSSTNKEIVANNKNAIVGTPMNVAIGVSTIQDLFDLNGLRVAMIPHEYEKINIISTPYKFGFEKNSAKVTFTKADSDQFTSNITGGAKIKDITINGFASPEGPESFNVSLSKNRANNTKKILEEQMRKAKVSGVSIVSTGNGPDWDGFLEEVKKSDLKDKNTIINVINSSSQNKKEQEIKNMILIYPELEGDFLSPLRRSDVSVNVYSEPKSDAQILSIAKSSDASSLTAAELDYAGLELAKTAEDKIKIYNNEISMLGGTFGSYNNLAVVYMQVGDIEKAEKNLDKANQINPNDATILNNYGVLFMHKGNISQAQDYFNQASKLGLNTNYNRGVIQLMDGRYSEALTLMNSKCNYNMAVAQTAMKDYGVAKVNLNCIPQTAETYYLKALIGAKTNDIEYVISNLRMAIELKPTIKDKIINNCDFKKFETNNEFKEIVK